MYLKIFSILLLLVGIVSAIPLEEVDVGSDDEALERSNSWRPKVEPDAELKTEPLPLYVHSVIRSLSESGRASVAEASSQLLQAYMELELAEEIEVDPEEREREEFSSWDERELKMHCMKEKEFKSQLDELYEPWTQDAEEDTGRFVNRNARSLLREIYHMSSKVDYEGKSLKCLTESNIQEIIDLLLTMGPQMRDDGDSLLNFDPSTLQELSTRTISDDHMEEANSIATFALEQVEKSKEREKITNQAMRKKKDNNNNNNKKKDKDKDKDKEYENEKENGAETDTEEEIGQSSETVGSTCKHIHKKCCLLYEIPSIAYPSVQYQECCFMDFYPQADKNWNERLSSVYYGLESHEYAYVYCMIRK